jgi:zinc protease
LPRRILLLFAVVLTAIVAAPSGDPQRSVVRTTLKNGLRVVIVRDPLVPVATLEENYITGGEETPAGFPGMAHAQEHMAFRGCAGVSADQIAAIYAQLGGGVNADTQQNITQYFVTVPAQDLELALRLDSACMQDIEDLQEQWAEERGAIEQEVSRDLSMGVSRPAVATGNGTGIGGGSGDRTLTAHGALPPQQTALFVSSRSGAWWLTP